VRDLGNIYLAGSIAEAVPRPLHPKTGSGTSGAPSVRTTARTKKNHRI
jgi:hypothetical protein